MALAVYCGTVTPDALGALVGTLRPGSPHCILERPDHIDFPAAAEPVEPAQWDEGRIFGLDFELHWARRGEEFRVALTRDDGGSGEGLSPVSSLPPGLDREEHGYYLWGEDDARIGRGLEYRSIPGAGRAKLTVAEFYDGAGQLRHWRYTGLGREVDHE